MMENLATKQTATSQNNVDQSEHWVAGKSREQLLAELKVFLERLGKNPRSLPDRLRVAAIQLRLGRVEEAMVHYEGVLRGYTAEGQLHSAATLCHRLLLNYPKLTRIRQILDSIQVRIADNLEDTEPDELPLGAQVNQRTWEVDPTTPFKIENKPKEPTRFLVENRDYFLLTKLKQRKNSEQKK